MKMCALTLSIVHPARKMLAYSIITTKKKNECIRLKLANLHIHSHQNTYIVLYLYKNWPLIVCKTRCTTAMRAHMCSYISTSVSVESNEM